MINSYRFTVAVGALNWRLVSLLLLICCISHTAVAQVATAERGQFVARARVELAVSEFHAIWQSAWRESERINQAGSNRRQLGVRHMHVHCDEFAFLHRRLYAVSSTFMILPDSQFPMLQGSVSRFGTCPSWHLAPNRRATTEETYWRDGGIAETFRPSISSARRILLDKLGEASKVLESDDWLIGQRVRFLIDQRLVDSAIAVASECEPQRWWCSALLGRAYAYDRQFVLASKMFSRMRSQMPDSVLCDWDNYANLFPSSERSAYNALGCEGRRGVNETLWWLSDPLYRDVGNERWVEQDARQVDIAIRRFAIQDERHTFKDEYGGDAVVAALYRYGWPSYFAWALERHDRLHDHYLLSLTNSAPVPPYTSFEYQQDRVSAIPGWRAVASPYSSESSDWELSRYDEQGKSDFAWWPVEHFKPLRPLVQLGEGQTVLLRRQESVEIASAVRLDHPALLLRGGSYDALMLTARGADLVDSIGQTVVPAGGSAVLRGFVSSDSALLAMEARNVGGSPLDARSRFAIKLPSPLSAMQKDEVAISDIAFIAPDSVGQHPNAPSADLLNRLLGTVSLDSATRRVVLYWESYGVSSNDSVVTLIRVTTDLGVGLMRRIGMAAGVASDPNTSMSVRWSAIDNARSTATLSGPVPVQIRAFLLDMTKLSAGDYILEIEMQLPSSGRRLTSQRRFKIGA